MMLLCHSSGEYVPLGGDDDAYLAMCLAVKNQPADTVEFVKYHSYIGVRKIYV